ncbi:MAG: hypothetical protein OEZ36_14325 [Spirochaetota bacterium]|nr:hypothetical protein [Spirochaetota bacterium]
MKTINTTTNKLTGLLALVTVAFFGLSACNSGSAELGKYNPVEDMTGISIAQENKASEEAGSSANTAPAAGQNAVSASNSPAPAQAVNTVESITPAAPESSQPVAVEAPAASAPVSVEAVELSPQEPALGESSSSGNKGLEKAREQVSENGNDKALEQIDNNIAKKK